jgi:hypothetical protein
MQRQLWLSFISEGESKGVDIVIEQATTYNQLLEYCNTKAPYKILKLYFTNGAEINDQNVAMLRSGDIIKALTVNLINRQNLPLQRHLSLGEKVYRWIYPKLGSCS